MSKNPKKILLVEGIADKSFYESFCKVNGLSLEVLIDTPRGQGASKNSKQGAIQLLFALLPKLDQEDGLERLALIVDADQISDGGGFQKTVDQVASIVAQAGFSPQPKTLPDGGLLFEHTNGLNNFGLWVMPDNSSEGSLENWIAQTVHVNQKSLYNQAESVVCSLGSKKFKPIRQIKAEVATWMAWQEKPGEGLYYAIEGSLLDQKSQSYLGLKQWLEAVFK